ncbi:anion transporter [Clostridium sp. DL-VIII]|uniref:SLC13 family permease n=1 Tax=Clostridium sp. DL-VIII TaxID=641107 RepID=UPI00023AF354|nr:DASS family sodium-coupled anion symporter [Clostridium sp. DL-VIII]EHI97726.1 anion transporter [Clostridium sp. DL-VIII]
MKQIKQEKTLGKFEKFKLKWGIPISIVVLIIFLLLPCPKGLSVEGQRCLAVFSAAFVLYLSEAIPASIVSLAVVPVLAIFNIVSIKDALSGFSSTSTYLIVGSFILAAAMLKSKLADRITYLIMLKIGTSARNITLGILMVNIVLAFMVPSSTARTAMLLPICINIINKFRGESREKTKFGANILLTLCCTNSTISSGILTSTISNPMAVQYISDASGRTVTFGEWFTWGFPPALIMTFVAWGIIQIMFKPEVKELKGGKSFIQGKMNELGKLNINEVKAIIVLGITIILWAFGDKVGVDSTTACLLGACALCIPKIGFLSWDDCKNSISLSVVFITSGGISLGAAMSSSGTAKWMAEGIFNSLHLGNYSAATMIIILIIVVQFMHVVFVGTATMANVFFPILIGIASVANINPILTIIPSAMMLGGYPIIMFFNTTPNILCYDTGEIGSDVFPKFGTILSILACAVYAICVLIYWPLIGMI